MNPLHSILRKLIYACVTGVWVLSDRRQAALAAIARMVKAESKPGEPWRLAVWNSLTGLRVDGMRPEELQTVIQAVGAASGQDIDLSDPTSVVLALKALRPTNGKGSTLLVMENAEEDLERRNFRQALETRLWEGKQDRTFVIFLSGVVNIPQQLKTQIRLVEHPLPTRQEIERTLKATCEPYGAWPTDAGQQAALLGVCGGLTETQIESAAAEAIIDLDEGAVIEPLHIALSKRESLAACGLELWTGKTTLNDVIGLDGAKRVFAKLLRPDLPPIAQRRGVVLLGIPGTGKTYITGAAAHDSGWQMMKWNPNNCKGSLQGETEANFRRTLQTIEAQAKEGGRLVLLIDEMEKLFQGFSSAGARSDGGVMAGIGGQFMSWLADRPKGTEVFVVGTCNDLTSINTESAGATTRAGRFNTTLFFDFPTPAQRAAAWTFYRAKYKIPTAVPAIKEDSKMTPAEIAAVCEAFVIYECANLDESRGYVPLVAVTSAEPIERLRKLANGRYVDANRPGLFTLDAAADDPPAVAPAPRVQRRRPSGDGGALFGG